MVMVRVRVRVEVMVRVRVEGWTHVRRNGCGSERTLCALG